jgi:phosphoglycerate dehydrogenase-like enzyme
VVQNVFLGVSTEGRLSMAWTVLVTARAFWVSGQEAHNLLEANGCRVIRSKEAGPLPEEDMIAALAGCDAVIGSMDPYTARVFAACPQLKIVSRCGVGIDSVDLKAATEAGIVVTNTPGAMTDAVADYTFGLMLALARRIPQGDALMRSGGWGEYPGVLVCGKTLGLVGLGQIGQGVARRAQGFGMRVLAYDPAYLPPHAPPSQGEDDTIAPPLQGEDRGGVASVEIVGLDELLEQSDFVSLHAPKLPETDGMFNAARFAQMKPTAFFINTARGALVEEGALIEALEEGQIAGAALDVYREEPLPADHPLRRAPHCLLTPHNAFNAAEAAAMMSRLSAENVLSLMRGERPASVCNPDVWERRR